MALSALLYNEMVTTGAVLHGDRERMLGFNSGEHPLALQLGGSEPGDLARSLKGSLRAAGYAVDVSADGVEGLYLGEEYPIDLAIIDLGLPELPGLDVIRRLRSRGRDFPILVLTARSEWQDKVEGLEAGAADRKNKSPAA